MKILNIILAALALGLCSCTNVSYTAARGENGNMIPKAKQVLITNYGYYLFNCVPLFSGGEDDGSFSLFSRNIKLEKAMNTLKAECERLDVKKVSEIQYDEKATCFFSWVEIIGTTLGIYWYKDYQLSAVLYSDKFNQE